MPAATLGAFTLGNITLSDIDDTPAALIGPSSMVTTIERTGVLTISHTSAQSSMVLAIT